ncbi:MAG: nitronate monooxygenase family protein [Pseudomonadota bacterium]
MTESGRRSASARPLLPQIFNGLRLPAIAAPMFLVSGPQLVIAQAKAGIIGSFPALNAKEADGEPIALMAWLKEIDEALDRHNQAFPDRPAAPFAVNLIVHRSNGRLERDLEICLRASVKILITSLGAQPAVNQAAHGAGAIVLHDVINNTFARKAIEKGADGLVAVAAGAGGHAGHQNPLALLGEIRAWFDGPLMLSGAIATGRSLLAAKVMGADLGYIGSPFIATQEANAHPEYKAMIVNSSAEDIITSSSFSGVSGNYLRPSIVRAGLDPLNLEEGDTKRMNYGGGSSKPKAWSQIWGAGQGIGAVDAVVPVETLVARLEHEYRAALLESAALASAQS